MLFFLLFFPAREVLAASEVLDMPDRVDWTTCKGTVEEETQWASDFRNAFKDFDFNFEDDDDEDDD